MSRRTSAKKKKKGDDGSDFIFVKFPDYKSISEVLFLYFESVRFCIIIELLLSMDESCGQTSNYRLWFAVSVFVQLLCVFTPLTTHLSICPYETTPSVSLMGSIYGDSNEG